MAAVYAQDQIELSKHLQVVAGLRFDRFDLTYHNNRNGETLDRPDNLVSPRAGVVFKPIAPVSIYSSYSVSYLPSSGDQFSSLTTITQQVKPEQFRNYEIGAKWDVVPNLSMTTAVYRLDRTNTRSTDPNDPTRIVQTGSQRTNGYELGANGNLTSLWSIAGGYTYQDAFVTSATTAAAAGAQVAQVPHHTLSMWNNYQVHPRFAAGLGILSRTEMFATIDNTRAVAWLHARGRGRLLEDHAAAARSAERGEPVRQGVLHQRRQQHQHLAGISARGSGRPDGDLLVEERVGTTMSADDGPAGGRPKCRLGRRL